MRAVAERPQTKQQVVEQRVSQGLIAVGVGLVILLIGAFLWRYFKLAPAGWVGVISFVGLSAYALASYLQAKRLPTLLVACPICDYRAEHLVHPQVNYICESCHEEVVVDNGTIVPAQLVTCKNCHAQLKVSPKATRVTCDQCHHAFSLIEEKTAEQVAAEEAAEEDIFGAYNAVLVGLAEGTDQQKVCLAVQSLFGLSDSVAEDMTTRLPSVLARNLSKAKADFIRRELREAGAVVRLDPVGQRSAVP